MVISDDKIQSVYTQLTSRIDKVKVYAAGATVTRIAELRLSAGEVPEQVEIAGLLLAVDDSSVRVRVEAERGTAAIATDVRVGLAVPPRQRVQQSPTDEEVREAKAEVRRIEEAQIAFKNDEKLKKSSAQHRNILRICCQNRLMLLLLGRFDLMSFAKQSFI